MPVDLNETILEYRSAPRWAWAVIDQALGLHSGRPCHLPLGTEGGDLIEKALDVMKPYAGRPE